MNSRDPDQRLRDMNARAVIPPDLCASRPEDVEAMLDAVETEPFSDEEVERLLAKARGDLSIGTRAPAHADYDDSVCEELEEALALFREEGEPDAVSRQVEDELRRKLLGEADDEPTRLDGGAKPPVEGGK